MVESQSIPAGGIMLKAMLVGFVLGFVLMGTVRGSMPALPETLAAERV